MLNRSKLLNGALFVSLFVLAPLTSAHATANLLTNGSFEDGAFAPNGEGFESLNPGATDIFGWTVTNNEMAWGSNTNIYGLTSSDGDKFLDLTGYHNASPYGGVAQTIDTIVGRTYTVSFDIGDSTNSNPLLNGPVAVEAKAGTADKDFFLAPSASGNLWQHYSYDFVATDTTTAVSFTGASGVDYIGLDNASVTLNPVPEASTVILFVLCAGGMVLVARRKSSQTIA